MWGKEERVSGFICETVRADTTKGDGGGDPGRKVLVWGGGYALFKKRGLQKKKNLLIRLRFRDKMTLCVGLQEYIIVYSEDFFNSAQ